MGSKYIPVYLIRHGENEISLKDPKLTEVGCVQARSLSLLSWEVDGIISSPTRRTLETAVIISESLKVPYHVHDLLMERIDFSDVPDLGYAKFRELCAKSTDDRNYVLPNGESSYTSGLRLEYLITRTANIAKRGIIIVTHQGVISDYLRNKFSASELAEKSLLFSQIREDSLANCSITRIDVYGNNHMLQYVGRKHHE